MIIAFILGMASGFTLTVESTVIIGLAIIGVGSVWVGLGYNLRYLTLKTIEERIIQVLSGVPPDIPITLSPIMDFAQ